MELPDFTYRQLFVTIAVGYSALLDGLTLNAPVFMSLQPDFSCSDTFNGTYDNECYSNCTEYIFQESTFSESIVTKYQLVCKKDHLGPLITAAGHFGIGIASIAGGYFGDKFGRVNSMLIVSATSLTMYLAIMYHTSYMQYLILWTLLNSISIARYNSMATYTVEVVGEKYRSTFGLMCNIYYGSGFMLLSILGYIANDWRKLMLTSVIVHIPALFYIFLPKSPNWLQSKGKPYEKAFKKLTGLEVNEIDDDNNVASASQDLKALIESEKIRRQNSLFSPFLRTKIL